MQKATGIIKADAFHLPFADAMFDVAIADPPYELPGRKKGRGKAGVSQIPYVGFRGREWYAEADRVLKATGRLYVFAGVIELPAWLSLNGGTLRYSNLLAWHAPNAIGIAQRFHKKVGSRYYTWRPILEWTKPDAGPLERIDGLLNTSSVIHNLICGNMHEALPWPNQILLAVTRWLLAPVPGSMVLDLFSGTGTTRVVAEEMGRRVVSVELADEAIAINRARTGTRGLDTLLERA